MRRILVATSRYVFIALIGVLILRAIVLFVALPTVGSAASDPSRFDDGFPDGYGEIAWNLLQGHGYNLLPDASGTMFRTPGYVLFLVPIFAAFGKNMLAIQIAQYIVSLCTAYLVYLAAIKITEIRSVGIVASLLYLVNPLVIIADSRALTESFLAFCVTGFMLLLYKALEAGLIRHWVYAGIVFGWILLVRSSAALFPIFLVFIIYERVSSGGSREPFRRSATFFGAFCLSALLVLSPWIVRNYIVSGKFEPTMTVRGAALFQSVYLVKESATERDEQASFGRASELMDQMARDMQVPYRPGFLPYFYNLQDEVTFYGNLGGMASKYIGENPAVLVKLISNNSLRFWFKGVRPGVSYLNILAILPMLALAVVGIIFSFRAGIRIMPFFLFSMAYYLSYLPMLAFARYCIPLLPFLCIASAIAVHGIFSFGRGVPFHRARA